MIILILFVSLIGITSILLKPSLVEEIGFKHSSEKLHLSSTLLSIALTTIFLLISNLLMIVDSLGISNVIEPTNKAILGFNILVLLILNISSILSFASNKRLDNLEQREVQSIFKVLTYVCMFNVAIVFIDMMVNAFVFI